MCRLWYEGADLQKLQCKGACNNAAGEYIAPYKALQHHLHSPAARPNNNYPLEEGNEAINCNEKLGLVGLTKHYYATVSFILYVCMYCSTVRSQSTNRN